MEIFTPEIRKGYKDGLTLRYFGGQIKNYINHKKEDRKGLAYDFGVWGGVITFNSILTTSAYMATYLMK